MSQLCKVISISAVLFVLGGFLGEKSFAKKEMRVPSAGIGKVVSEKARTLKESENKTHFGKEIRELAGNKERIEKHKEAVKSRKK